MSHQAGDSRCVNWIDFILFIVPTLLVEIYEKYFTDWCNKERNRQSRLGSRFKPTIDLDQAFLAKNETCNALLALSRACELSQKFTISDVDLKDIDRYSIQAFKKTSIPTVLIKFAFS